MFHTLSFSSLAATFPTMSTAPKIPDVRLPNDNYLTNINLRHPFLDFDHTMSLIQSQSPPYLVNQLIPPAQTMAEITIDVDSSNKVPRALLQ